MFCSVAISNRVQETKLFLSHLARYHLRKFTISIHTQRHNIHIVYAQKQMAAFVLWLTHILRFLPPHIRPAVSIFQYAQCTPRSIIPASLASGWGWCDTSHLFYYRAQMT